MRRSFHVLMIALLLFGAACSDDAAQRDDAGATEICDNLRDDDQNGQVDCYDPACATAPHCIAGPQDGSSPEPDGGTATDAAPPDASSPDTLAHDTAPPALTSLQAIVDAMDLPTSSTDHAGDVDGDGTSENQAGKLMGVLNAANVSLQAALDSSIDAGGTILLLDLRENSARAGGFELQNLVGEDLDGIAWNNFSGSEELGVAASSPQDALMAASLDGSSLTANGKLVVGLPLGGGVVVLSLQMAHLEATVGSDGMHDGWLYGAVPMEEVDTKLIGGFVEVLNDPLLTTPTIFAIFDTDASGEVTAEELRNNFLIKALLVPDVDTDGDNVPDAMSFGAGFSAVPCVIVP